MLAQQRHAIFNLTVALTTLAIFLALLPYIGPVRAQAAFAFLAVLAFGPLVQRKRPGEIASDERDHAIFLRATQLTFIFFWLIFVAATMAAYYAMKNRGVISVELIPLLIWLACVTLLLIHSTILLILYPRS